VVYSGQDPDTNMPVVHAYLNPLVKWIWLGGCIVVFGTLLALAPNRRAAIALSAVPEPASSPVVPALNPSVTLREGHD
jgi:cytochrome c biogenesis factor